MAALACAGNTMVLLGRLVAREPNPVHSLYIKTLAMADLMMGVYLLIIAATDWRYRNVYVRHDFEWRHSSICNACGQCQPKCLRKKYFNLVHTRVANTVLASAHFCAREVSGFLMYRTAAQVHYLF